MILFRLNTHSGVPPYLQIVQQVKQSLQIGVLRPGDRLPTVKEAVAHAAVNPNTVAKAYRTLENQGLVEGRVGSGTFVTQRPAGPSPEVQEMLGNELQTWLTKAHRAGLDEESIEALVRVGLQKTKVRGGQL